MEVTEKPISVILARLSQELAHWSQQSLEVQRQFVRGEMTGAGQALDVLHQHLAGLADYVDGLATTSHTDHEGLAALTDRITLSELSARLGGRLDHFSAPSTGDFELF